MSTDRPPNLDSALVEQIARLSRLELDPETGARLARDLAAFLEHVADLQGLDTAGVPPTFLAGEATRVRESGERLGLAQADRVRNAPDVDPETGAFRVPRVI